MCRTARASDRSPGQRWRCVMSWLDEGQNVVNTVVDTTEQAVDAVVNEANDAGERGEDAAANAAVLVDTLVNLVVSVADDVAPTVGKGLIELKEKTSHALRSAVLDLAIGVLSAVIAIGVESGRLSVAALRLVLSIVSIAGDVVTFAVTREMKMIGADIDKLRTERQRLNSA